MKVLLIIFCLLLVPLLTYASGIGVSFTSTPDGVDYGGVGEWETDRIDIEVALTGPDFYVGKLDIAYRIPVWKLEFEAYQHNDFKGYSLMTLNRTNDLGVSTILPIGNFDVAVSVFGRDSNPQAPKNKYDENTGELLTTTPGLTILDQSTVHLALGIEFDVQQFEIELKGLTNLHATIIPQWLLAVGTGGDIGPINWVFNIEYVGQRYDGDIEGEVSTNLTAGIDF